MFLYYAAIFCLCFGSRGLVRAQLGSVQATLGSGIASPGSNNRIVDSPNAPWNRPAYARPVNYRPANQPANYRPANQPGNYRPANQPANYRPANQPGNYRPANQPVNYRPANQPGYYRPGNRYVQTPSPPPRQPLQPSVYSGYGPPPGPPSRPSGSVGPISRPDPNGWSWGIAGVGTSGSDVVGSVSASSDSGLNPSEIRNQVPHPRGPPRLVSSSVPAPSSSGGIYDPDESPEVDGLPGDLGAVGIGVDPDSAEIISPPPPIGLGINRPDNSDDGSGEYVSPNIGRWSVWGPWGSCTNSCGEGVKNRTKLCIPLRARCGPRPIEYDECIGNQCNAGGSPPSPSPIRELTGQSNPGEPFSPGPPAPWNQPSPFSGPYAPNPPYRPSYPARPASHYRPQAQPSPEPYGPYANSPSWQPWTPFGACSRSCNGGIRHRTRLCTPVGQSCPPQSKGYDVHSIPCNTQSCPTTTTMQTTTKRRLWPDHRGEIINAQWTEWTVFGQCGVTCGGGLQYRTRLCRPMNHECDGKKHDWEQRKCNDFSCAKGQGLNQPRPTQPSPPPQPPTPLPSSTYGAFWGQWTAYGECSVTCGKGVRYRARICRPANAVCAGKKQEFDESECYNLPCPWNGNYPPTPERFEPPTNPPTYQPSTNPPAYQPPETVRWSQWSSWTLCQGSCNSAQARRIRTRSCETVGPYGYSQAKCPGLPIDSETCVPRICLTRETTTTTKKPTTTTSTTTTTTITTTTTKRPSTTTSRQTTRKRPTENSREKVISSGPWLPWSKWGSCSKTCGGGKRRRRRRCVFGRCRGPSYQALSCNDQLCPGQTLKPSEWNSWSKWSKCSALCGSGRQYRSRTCLKGTLKRSCQGRNSEYKSCLSLSCSKPSTKASTKSTTASGIYERRSSFGSRINSRPFITESAAPSTRTTEATTTTPSTTTKAPRSNPLRGPPWLAWGEWERCTVTCGGGKRKRVRKCLFGKCVGSSTEEEVCNRNRCPPTYRPPSVSRTPIPYEGNSGRPSQPHLSRPRPTFAPISRGAWSNWTPWQQCSATCGAAVKKRYRICISRQLCDGSPQQVDSCVLPRCPNEISTTVTTILRPGIWSSWGTWNPCTLSCGTGVKSRYRSCVSTDPCKGTAQQIQRCQIQPCGSDLNRPLMPNNDGWGPWNEWSPCDKSCDRGWRSRTRSCLSAGQCVGNIFEQGTCNDIPCRSGVLNTRPIHTQWGQWIAWGSCTTTCGPGTRTRTRLCTRRFPQDSCPGPLFQEGRCNNGACSPSNVGGLPGVPLYYWGGSGWSVWSKWSACTKHCGDGGIQERNRTCLQAPCTGYDTEEKYCSRRCNDFVLCEPTARPLKCPRDYILEIIKAQYGRPLGDRATCPGGLDNRQPKFYRPRNGGQGWLPTTFGQRETGCRLNVTSDVSKKCNGKSKCRLEANNVQFAPTIFFCPDVTKKYLKVIYECRNPRVWNRWGEWQPCSKSCNSGTQRRTRTCQTMGMCTGSDTDERACNTNRCPSLTRWSEWNKCSAACNTGYQFRTRKCVPPEASHLCDGELSERRECNTQKCIDFHGHRQSVNGCRNTKKNILNRSTKLACASACGAWIKCRGFVFKTVTKQCLLYENWCLSKGSVEPIAGEESFKKLDPAGLLCGYGTCKKCGVFPPSRKWACKTASDVATSTFEGIPSIDLCYEQCSNADWQCKAIQFTKGSGMCHLFQSECLTLEAESQTSFCIPSS